MLYQFTYSRRKGVQQIPTKIFSETLRRQDGWGPWGREAFWNLSCLRKHLRLFHRLPTWRTGSLWQGGLCDNPSEVMCKHFNVSEWDFMVDCCRFTMWQKSTRTSWMKLDTWWSIYKSTILFTYYHDLMKWVSGKKRRWEWRGWMGECRHCRSSSWDGTAAADGPKGGECP